MEGRVRVAIVMLVLVTFCPSEGISRCPVVLVPGAGGSTIEARVTEDAEPPIKESCSGMGHDWFMLWMDLDLISSHTQCFLDSMKLYYDTELDDYGNTPGLETRVPGFGSPTNNPLLGVQMAKILESLREIGYEDDVNLFGAPYDFRYGLATEGHPSSVGSQFLQDLKDLVETASATNEGKPVILVPLSLGGLFALQLLNRNSLSWRQQYIKHFVPVATPWGGTVTTMAAFASGDDDFEPLNISRLEIRNVTRSFESTLWAMPNPGKFAFVANKTLVETPTVNYTAYDMGPFIYDTTGLPSAARPYVSRILPLVENLIAPEVDVTLITGTNVPTPEKFIYNGTFDQPPKNDTGDGDGLVNLVSALRIQLEWAQNPNQPTPKIIELPGKSHGEIFVDDDAIKVIIDEISLINGNCDESPALSVWTGKANA